jgi:hypothetical protein
MPIPLSRGEQLSAYLDTFISYYGSFSSILVIEAYKGFGVKQGTAVHDQKKDEASDRTAN